MTLREDALRIWQSGVDAVNSERLTFDQIELRPDLHQLTICGTRIQLPAGPNDFTGRLRHIEVVGAGKAGAGMASGVEAALQDLPQRVTFSGWVNVPEDCVRVLPHIHLHGARPPGINEPTRAAVAGTAEILRRVRMLGPNDLCLVLISGGGSALLCQPVPQITLDDKLAVIRALASDGAPIHELNLVRTQLSAVKGGRLAAACRAGRMLTLIISDVVGNPLSVIASGPTVEIASCAVTALRILKQRGLTDDSIPQSVLQYLHAAAAHEQTNPAAPMTRELSTIAHHLIGTNQTAMDAAARTAVDLGYEVISAESDQQGRAANAGRDLFAQLARRRSETTPRQPSDQSSGSSPIRRATNSSSRFCVLSGGEPTVQLASTDQPRSGGRNQELVLAAVAAHPRADEWQGIVLLSGGTDGEDGPTDAAGAFADELLVERMSSIGLIPNHFLAINNSYPFFDELDGLIRTGPTHTNVMDLRVGLVAS